MGRKLRKQVPCRVQAEKPRLADCFFVYLETAVGRVMLSCQVMRI